ncbi:MAG: class I SAM-dependent methyltransferase [Acidimicrobiales bacterium]
MARWPFVPQALDAADWVLRRCDHQYASLPPASLRIRIGVSNRILRNADVFQEGQFMVRQFVDRGWVGEGARILELGSGVGRNTIGFKDQVYFESYDGIDVDAEMVSWCVDNVATPAVRFHHANLFSAVYNPFGLPVTEYRLPFADNSTTFSLGISVFSHLLRKDAAHYAAELGRVTEGGGLACHTFFLLDHIQSRLGDRWTFAHEVDGCWVENPKYPEAAVAYWEKDVTAMFARHGLHIVDVLDKHLHQQMVVFRREG